MITYIISPYQYWQDYRSVIEAKLGAAFDESRVVS